MPPQDSTGQPPACPPSPPGIFNSVETVILGLSNLLQTLLPMENIYEFVEGEIGEAETSFTSEEFLPDCVPAGLYCVIDDFLSEYKLRLLEEEQRAMLLQVNQQRK